MIAELKKQDDVLSLPVRGEEVTYFDAGRDNVRGLALRVRPNSRTWVFIYRFGAGEHRKQYKLTLGAVADGLTLEGARKLARRWHDVIRAGQNPAEVQRAEKSRQDTRPTLLKSIVADYLALREKDLKPGSLKEVRHHLEHHWQPLHGLDITSIDQGTVASHLGRIERDSGPVARNRARSALSSLLTWARQEGHPVTNVANLTRKAEERSRDRVLTNSELAAIWTHARKLGDYGRVVRLLMLTGQRRMEIGALDWSEIKTDEQGRRLIALPASRTKNGRPHDVPLSAEALDIIESTPRKAGRAYLFATRGPGLTGYSKYKRILDAALGIPQWGLHDLRRTMVTKMADSPDDGGLGVLPHVIEAIINHASGHKAGVAGIYNRSTYAAEKRTALDAWGKRLMVIVAQASGQNVVTLRGTAVKATTR